MRLQAPPPLPSAALSLVGGLKPQLATIAAALDGALRNRARFRQLGLPPPRGLLLFGPPGTGKTLVARAVGAAAGCAVVVLNGAEAASKYYGETEAKVRSVVSGRWTAVAPAY